MGFGLANKLTFYPSSLLYSYAIGRLDASTTSDIDDKTLKSMVTLEPSKWHKLSVTAGDYINYQDKLEVDADKVKETLFGKKSAAAKVKETLTGSKKQNKKSAAKSAPSEEEQSDE